MSDESERWDYVAEAVKVKNPLGRLRSSDTRISPEGGPYCDLLIEIVKRAVLDVRRHGEKCKSWEWLFSNDPPEVQTKLTFLEICTWLNADPIPIRMSLIAQDWSPVTTPRASTGHIHNRIAAGMKAQETIRKKRNG